MRTLLRMASIAFAAYFLTGCGEEDFTGAYRFTTQDGTTDLVLNVHDGKAQIYIDMRDQNLISAWDKVQKGATEYTVKNGKLLFDYGKTRIAMERNVDEQSLDCLNCQEAFKKPMALWKHDPKGPYDLDDMLEKQTVRLVAEYEAAEA
jgi:hypothetical protein